MVNIRLLEMSWSWNFNNWICLKKLHRSGLDLLHFFQVFPSSAMVFIWWIFWISFSYFKLCLMDRGVQAIFMSSSDFAYLKFWWRHTIVRHSKALRTFVVINYTLFLFTVYTGPDNSSVPVCLGCYRKVNGSYRCPGCKWPLCSGKTVCMRTHKTSDWSQPDLFTILFPLQIPNFQSFFPKFVQSLKYSIPSKRILFDPDPFSDPFHNMQAMICVTNLGTV